MDVISLLYIEEQKILRQCLQNLLEEVADISLIGNGAPDFLHHPETRNLTSVDVVLVGALSVDYRPYALREKLLSNVRAVHQLFPAARIIATCPEEAADVIIKILNLGVFGIVSKSTSFEDLCDVIRFVSKGQHYFCPEISASLKKEISNHPTGNSKAFDLFSDREMDVLKLIAKGWTSNEISERLFIAPKTVETHRKNMVRKSGTKNTIQLVAFAFGNDIL